MSTTHERPASRRYGRFIAGAAATLALGGSLAACGSSAGTTASSTAATVPAANAAATPSGTPGARPDGRGPGHGFGTEVTGANADKAKAAALDKYPGTVERVEQLPDGSYLVHVIRSSGSEIHVKVSKAFAVTGTEQGFRGGHRRPGGSAPGFGKEVTGANADKAKAAALDKYPGTVERVEQLSDGSYVVHVIRSSGSEVHVKVSKAFAVTGIEQGPGPHGGPRPSGGDSSSGSTSVQ